jgi:hypothetical protein
VASLHPPTLPGNPRVCRALALDGFLPPEFAHRGRRLVYTEGIVVLALLAGVRLVAFGGSRIA